MWLVGFHTGSRCCRVPGTRPAGKSTRRRRSRAGSRSRSRGTRRGPWRCIPMAKTPGPPIARRPCWSSTRSSRSRSRGPGLRGRRSRSRSHRTSSWRWRRTSTRSSRLCRTCLCGNQSFMARSSSTPSTRRLLDGVAMPVPRRSTEPERSSSTPSTRRLLDSVAVPVPHRSTEPARQRHRREMT